MPAPRRILLIQLRAIGDVILTTPAIRVLKRHYPTSEIDFLANPVPAEVLQHNPHLNSIIVYPHKASSLFGLMQQSLRLRRRKYDVVIDFLGTSATAAMTLLSGAPLRIGYRLRFRRMAYTHHELDYRGDIYNALTKFSLLRSLGISEEEWQPEIFVPDETHRWARDLFAELKLADHSVVALAPQAKRPPRQWPGERFAQVGNWLQSRGHRVLLLWGPGEREYVESVARLMDPAPILSPKTTLLQSAAILKRCRLLVCNCGGAKHIAVAAGTPTFTIHGPTDPRVWTPPNHPAHRFIHSPTGRTEEVSADEVIRGIQAMQVL
jgi:ADP-heptose:LPS heptosyltransferase